MFEQADTWPAVIAFCLFLPLLVQQSISTGQSKVCVCVLVQQKHSSSCLVLFNVNISAETNLLRCFQALVVYLCSISAGSDLVCPHRESRFAETRLSNYCSFYSYKSLIV